MSKSQKQAEMNIQTFLRIKPSKNASGFFNSEEKEGENTATISVNLPDNFRSEYIDNSKLNHIFHFNGIIHANASQEDVFKIVGSSAVQNAIGMKYYTIPH
jgi:hypothetical protein